VIDFNKRTGKSGILRKSKFTKTDIPSALNYNPSFNFIFEKPKTCKAEYFLMLKFFSKFFSGELCDYY
jgi:hypothetical protein